MHRSTFTLTYITNPELCKVPQKSRLNEFIFYSRRFPKKDESVPKPPISLAMNTLGSEKLCILPTKPIRPSHKEVKVDPWKYSYSKNKYSADYIERIKILRSTCFDLSKYWIYIYVIFFLLNIFSIKNFKAT